MVVGTISNQAANSVTAPARGLLTGRRLACALLGLATMWAAASCGTALAPSSARSPSATSRRPGGASVPLSPATAALLGCPPEGSLDVQKLPAPAGPLVAITPEVGRVCAYGPDQYGAPPTKQAGLDSATAKTVADDLNALPTIRPGVYNCEGTNEGYLVIMLSGSLQMVIVQIETAGCGFASNSNRTSQASGVEASPLLQLLAQETGTPAASTAG